jgi:hypothetical protein
MDPNAGGKGVDAGGGKLKEDEGKVGAGVGEDVGAEVGEVGRGVGGSGYAEE